MLAVSWYRLRVELQPPIHFGSHGRQQLMDPYEFFKSKLHPIHRHAHLSVLELKDGDGEDAIGIADPCNLDPPLGRNRGVRYIRGVRDTDIHIHARLASCPGIVGASVGACATACSSDAMIARKPTWVRDQKVIAWSVFIWSRKP
jgi:hypothetical protein